MNKPSDQHIALMNRLQEMQKDQQIISSINTALAKVLDKKSIGIILNQSFKDTFLCNEVIVLTTKEGGEFFYSSFTEKNDHHSYSSDIYLDQCIQSSEPVIFYLKNLSEKKTSTPSYFMNAKKMGMHTAVGFCLPSIGDQKNIIFLFYKNFTEFNDRLERILRGVSTQLSITIRNIFFFEKFDALSTSTPDSQKKTEPVGKEEKGNKKGFNGIIGDSEIMQQIYQHITQIASSSSNVIIYGETGTGKELIAQAIHDLSPSARKSMIRINCASIPANLIESELFGHEKGSFTGATEQRKGKFEQANGGTIFLDEIGELPLELQGRLLRVLQEKEVERIGGNKTIKVNARVIAATNRSLEKEVAEGKFRSDLFYRLNVLPIHLPPLRDRKEDIPLLANHFLEKINLKTGKKIKGFSQKVMDSMCKNAWPGNIRELENIIERSIIIAKDNVIREMDLPKIFKAKEANNDFHMKTLHQVEKEHILKIVENCNGRIFGPQGAALILGLPPTTLISKMQKLGIQKEHYVKKNEQ
ncbi:sigma-54 interaction domain-containing protein [Chryseobacterium daecheongense]|uniref:Sigma-54-dependent Fis family transcriptional regulator n=1 Tax=Chryseobacterium daecheongense TaxID=192389 RepID=A0A3N0W646_9FLAO|nr:sigma-54 dependent transcriptional regulator [Chryseobacterium daecheongense]ROI00251.1 sigma-54-dependent Fis family transcriptional regulator [Chryseobacterium daecheongense]TDX94791.1 transcriptional regulator with GAF, ATPase, and Fis domain [Chryseobacterium daecheongense]